MGLCVSCSPCARDNQVEDTSEQIDSDDSDDYVERIIHISADIHEMIRRKDHNKVDKEYDFSLFIPSSSWTPYLPGNL
jgi:hypothetical protein